MEWIMDSILDSSMDWTVQDYECLRGLGKGLHVHSHAFFIIYIHLSVYKAYYIGRYKIELVMDSKFICITLSTGDPINNLQCTRLHDKEIG